MLGSTTKSGRLRIRGVSERDKTHASVVDECTDVPDDDSSLSVVDDGTSAGRLKHRLMLADASAICVAIIVSVQMQMMMKPVPQYLVYKQLALLIVALPASRWRPA